MLWIEKIRIILYNFKSDGLVEWFNCILEDMISKYV